MRISVRRLAVPLLAALVASGCVTWGSQRVPGPSSSQRLLSPVRVTRADSSTLVVFDATMAADSIVGYTSADSASRRRVSVAVADVRKIEARKTDVLGTIVLTAAVTFVVGFAAYALALSSIENY